MTWFKVDDHFGIGPKALRAGNAACGLWVRAGSYSAAQLTDGLVDGDVVRLLGGRPVDVRKLVEADLWHGHDHDCDACPQPPRGSHIFHDWPKYQPMRADVQAQRAKRAEAGRLGGKASGRTRRGEANAKQVASVALEPPTRPDPTTAAAAAERRGGGSLDPSISVLLSKLRSHTALSAIAVPETFTPDQAQRIVTLIEAHGDQPLVDAAVRTTGITPPRYVTAYLGTWEAMAEGRATIRTLRDPDQHRTCADCGVPKSQHRGAGFDHDWSLERSA